MDFESELSKGKQNSLGEILKVVRTKAQYILKTVKKI
jgi:hypothetical protein